MILLIDNYDSFAHILQRYLVQLGQSVVVVRNDDPRLQSALSQAPQWSAAQAFGNSFADEFGGELPQALVISPGPKGPDQAGYCLELVRVCTGGLPILGVCLGHQVICQSLGATIIRAPRPVHGRAVRSRFLPSPLFDGLESPVAFARYHSLVADERSLPPELQPIAWSEGDEQLMAVAHRQHATFGVQFHPESILSSAGHRLLRNFLAIAGLPTLPNLPVSDLVDAKPLWDPTLADEHATSVEHAVALPRRSTGN